MKHERTIVLQSGSGGHSFALAVKRRLGARNLVMRLIAPFQISVSAPGTASIFEIEEFVRKHAEWIFTEQKRFEGRMSLLDFLRENPCVYCEGVRLNTSFINTNAKGYWIEDLRRGEIIFASKNEKAFQKLFMAYARDAIGRTLKNVASVRGLNAEKYSVRDQRSRWASRSSSGMLSFNWRIVLLEARFQEYIILHELAHEKFMDHSVSFWIHLSRLCENAKTLDRQITKFSPKIFQIQL